jgi:hypothetical protein
MHSEIETNPYELSAPHFDDEATIVSARQVVPIAKARGVEKVRAILWVCLFMLGSAAFGALGAIGVNYLEGARRTAALSSPQSGIIGHENNQTLASPTPGNSDPASKPETVAGRTISTSVTDLELKSSQGSEETNDSAGVTARESSVRKTLNKSPFTNGAGESKTGRVLRKTRRPSNSQNDKFRSIIEKPAEKKRGASRIQEIFEGSGPP